MTQEGVNQGRRRFLGAATAAVGAVGAVGVAVPFVGSWAPNEKAKAVGGPVKVDISKVEEGRLLRAEWRGKPIYILKRSPKVLETLASEELKSLLLDPDSETSSQQPEFAQNDARSLNGSDILILEGVCTHLGCAPALHYEVKAEPFDANWMGGFFCPCHGSKFDLAGRVFNGVPAPTNLPVPPHFIEDGVATIGIEGGEA